MIATLSWSVALSGLISVTYDGTSEIVLRMKDTNRRAYIERVIKRWEPTFGPIADEFEVPRSTVAGVIWQESGGDPHAKNPNDGGSGLMQLTGHIQDGIADIFDPVSNMTRGIRLLADIRKHTLDLPAILSIYNAGSPALLGDGAEERYVPAGTPGSRLTNVPWTNEAWDANHRKVIFETHWGYCTSPGYIDSVVAASNEYIIYYQGET